MRTRSDSRSSSSPRRRTIAFRLSGPERERIDALARGDGITTSDFARRAVFGGLDASTSAREEATERGRNQLRPEIARLEEELSRTQTLLATSRTSQHNLHERLTRAPEELTTAARQLVVGTPGSELTLAICWSRMDRLARCRAIPIIATLVAAEVDGAIGALGYNEAEGDQVPKLLDRLEWLMDALTPESGDPSAVADRLCRPEWAPLKVSYLKAVDWQLRGVSVLLSRLETEGESPLSARRALPRPTGR